MKLKQHKRKGLDAPLRAFLFPKTLEKAPLPHKGKVQRRKMVPRFKATSAS
jgi:hypothetical protein